MSRRTDKFKKILPTDVPRGLSATISTRGVETGRIDTTKPNIANTPKPLTVKKTRNVGKSSAVANKALELVGQAQNSLKEMVRDKVVATDFRIKLDFTIRVDGDSVIPEIFGPKYMDFIEAGLRATMLKEPAYAKRTKRTVDVLPGSRMSVGVKRIKVK